MSVLGELLQWVERKPLVLLRFEDGFERALRDSRRGIDRFTVAKPHGAFHELKLPTLCLAEMPDGETCKCYVGVVTSKAAITTFDSRLTVIKLRPLNLSSLDSLQANLGEPTFQTALKQRLKVGCFALGLSPKLTVAVVKSLAADPDNRKAMELAAFNIPKLRHVSASEWGQLDAIGTAMAAFGLSKTEFPQLVDVPDGSDSALNNLTSRAFEDHAIDKDASVIPGFQLLEKHITGRAVFLKGDEQLVVYTANKGPLETMLGVDLIYVNETVGNTVMVQYKMLEAHTDRVTAKTDWIFRPDDQLRSEAARMKLPPITGKIDDYRLHRSPFFFKFVRREGDGESHSSFVISLGHLNQLLDSPKSKGPKGGVRVSYDGLNGAYLRESDLIGLIRSGYIGTHRIESDALNPIISAVANGNRALVLGWQKRIREGGVP